MQILKSRRLLNKKIFVILLITFIWLMADNLLEFVFPTYLESVGKSYVEIGLLLSLVSIAGVLVDLPMGSLSDKASRRKLMISGLVLSIVAGILIFSLDGDLFLACSFLLWGFAYQVWRVPRDAYYASVTNKKHRAESYGFDAEVKYLGQTIGPLIGGFVLLYFGFTGILSFYSLFLFFAVLSLFFLVKESNHRSLGSAIFCLRNPSNYVSELKEFRSFGLFGVVLLFFALLMTAWEQVLFTFQPLFYGPDVLNIPPNLGGLLLASFSLPGIFLSFFIGRLADKAGKRIALLVGLVVMGVSLILFSQLHDLVSIFLLALSISVGWVVSVISLNALIVDLSYGHKKGEVVGVWDFFMDIGFVIGPVIGGFVAEIFGVRAVFFLMGFVFLTSSLLVLMIKDKKLRT